eukprot:2652645-Amphidinium_carterae.2
MPALKFCRSGRVAVTELRSQPMVLSFSHVSVSRLRCNGSRTRLMVKGQLLRSMIEAAAKACPDIEAISCKSAVGDRRQNGSVESAVRQLKAQMSAIRLALEGKMKRKLTEEDPMLTWTPNFAGDVIARFRKREVVSINGDVLLKGVVFTSRFTM